jgi:hypothetical protein
VEESARRERKSISDWVKPECDRAALLAGMEARAIANGYPPGWLTLFGSLVDDQMFAAPPRSSTRHVDGLNGD